MSSGSTTRSSRGRGRGGRVVPSPVPVHSTVHSTVPSPVHSTVPSTVSSPVHSPVRVTADGPVQSSTAKTSTTSPQRSISPTRATSPTRTTSSRRLPPPPVPPRLPPSTIARGRGHGATTGARQGITRIPASRVASVTTTTTTTTRVQVAGSNASSSTGHLARGVPERVAVTTTRIPAASDTRHGAVSSTEAFTITPPLSALSPTAVPTLSSVAAPQVPPRISNPNQHVQPPTRLPALLADLDRLRQIIGEYERHQCIASNNNNNTTSPTDAERTWYEQQYTEMQRLLRAVHQCRVRGDWRFECGGVVAGGMKGAWSRWISSSTTAAATLSAHAAASTAGTASGTGEKTMTHHIRVEAHTGRLTLRPVVLAESAVQPPHSFHTIEQLRGVRLVRDRKSLSPPTVVRFDWATANGAMHVSCAEAAELVEVVGSHLRHYNQKKVQHTIHLQRTLFPLSRQQILANPRTAEERSSQTLGVNLLLRLWNAFCPDESLLGDSADSMSTSLTSIQIARVLRDDRWKWFGFQSSTPASDFRGMGLLGLWLLVFSAERALGVIAPSLHDDVATHRTMTMTHGSRLTWLKDMVRMNRSSATAPASTVDTRKLRLGFSQLANHGREYPWAVAGINVGSMLVHTMLGMNDDLVNCPPSDPRWSSPLLNFLGHIETPDDDDTNSSEPTVRPRNAIANVELVFELAMELVERVYRRTGAGYMDFPQVLKRVEGMLCAWLRGETAANDDDEFVPGAMGAMPIHAVDESSMVVSFVRRIRITPNHTSDDGTIARPTSMAELWALADQHCPAPSF